MVDIFAEKGFKKPDISILWDKFLSDVRGMPQKNFAVELLQKLINDELKVRTKKNMIEAKSFRDMLEKKPISKYKNKSLEAAAVIEELIKLAKKMNESHKRGEKLNITLFLN